jgi:uncharacterized protein GlcG (DUF336 family)
MHWLDARRSRAGNRRLVREEVRTYARLEVEQLETRFVPSTVTLLPGGILSILGTPGPENITVTMDPTNAQIVISDSGQETARFASSVVTSIVLTGSGGGREYLAIDQAVTQPATITGGGGLDVLRAGGGPTILQGGNGTNKLIAGSAADILKGGSGRNLFFEVKTTDKVLSNPGDSVFAASDPSEADSDPVVTLMPSDVSQLLSRAAAASAADDGIVAIVDRGGRLLGVRVEGNVSPTITGNPVNLTFAIDGAIAEARTAAFFANNQAPLTSRTVEFISQSTITQRKVDSNPDITDPNSTLRGPGFVAPIGIRAHFPPNVPFTPQVDLFNIEGTNRDSINSPGPDHIRGTADDITLPSRFNVPTQFIPSGVNLVPPDSYGFLSGIDPSGQSRGIGTLPGGIPVFKSDKPGDPLQLVGGIGIFFPGKTGFASEENSNLSSNFDPSKPDRAMEAEYDAFAAVGGSAQAGHPIGEIAGVPPVPLVCLPFGRIDLVGITLDIIGPRGLQGPDILADFGSRLGTGDPNSGTNVPVDKIGDTLLQGMPVPDGWLVTPHAGGGLTADDVVRIVNQGIAQANQTRAAIRLPLDSTTRMVFAVSDNNGNILGLYRMPDSTIFSIDVAVAKARNVAYYANANQLQPADQVQGVPPGTALTNRTFRYLAEPRFPEGIDGAPPGPFSILNDGGTDPVTGLQVGPPLPASAFQSVQGFDAFNPQSNFHDPFNVANQNGIVFFPGSAPLYKNGRLVGGLGVSGDGVDQDDVVTFAAQNGFEPTASVLRADQTFVNGIRLPYQKFNRNPEGGIVGE